MRKTLKKEERLCSIKVIDTLFDRKNPANEGVFAYPIRAVFQKRMVVKNEEKEDIEVNNGSQVLFSVPKRQFKHAVDRNTIRRRMREAYRLNKSLLTGNFYVTFIYIGKGIEKYKVIEKGIKNALNKIK